MNAVGVPDWACLLGFGGFEFGRDVFGFAPSLASPSLPRGGENRLVGRSFWWAWLVVFRTQPLCGRRVGGSFTHRSPTEGQRWALTDERRWRTGLRLDSFAFGGRGVFEFGRDFLFFPPLWLRHLSRGGERIGWRAGLLGGLGCWFSGRNHVVVGGVWLLFPPSTHGGSTVGKVLRPAFGGRGIGA